MKGEGTVLGIDAGYQYKANRFTFEKKNLVILIGSDGVWEVENERGEQFGKQRVKDIMAANHHLPPTTLLHCITEEIERFRGHAPQTDDITLVALRIDGNALEKLGTSKSR